MKGLQPILPSTDLDRSTLDKHTKSESPAPVLTRWKGNNTSHTVQTASAPESTSPSSSIHSAFKHLGKLVRSGTVEEEEQEKNEGLVGRLMEKFYRSSPREAQCCLEHGQRLRTLWSACKNAAGTEDPSRQLALTLPEENDGLEMTERGQDAIHRSMSK